MAAAARVLPHWRSTGRAGLGRARSGRQRGPAGALCGPCRFGKAASHKALSPCAPMAHPCRVAKEREARKARESEQRTLRKEE